MPVFGNPLGLLALLGIPAVLAIHFLQRKARELPVSTLFLLDHTQREAVSGRRFERMIPSIPLWMQLLAVILLAWFLSEPRYPKSGSVQRIAIVMDSSASMSVFKNDAISTIETLIPSLKGSASNLEITVLESNPERPRIHTGTSVKDLTAALESWQPRDGPIDSTHSIRLARSLVSREGAVIYVTDTPGAPLPFNARRIAVGRPIDNVGFTGVSFTTEEGALVWHALVRNNSATPQTRSWRIESSNGASPPRSIDLAPGALIALQSAFPADAKNVRVTLDPDAFPLDDVLPLVTPIPKPLTIFAATSPITAALSNKLLHALDSAESSNDQASADLSITTSPATLSGNSILFVEDETRDGSWLKGGIIAESHPLMQGLHWQSLLARETAPLEHRPADTVLLWQDQRPLIFIRDNENQTRQLIFNFDPSLSNAERQPAFIVLLHRFAESIRSAKIAPVSLNLETGQPIELSIPPGDPPAVTATDPIGNPLPTATYDSAIREPGFMSIRQGDLQLLDAAVHFGDPREADFSACATNPPDEMTGTSATERHTRPDPFWRIAVLLVLSALLVSWKFTAARQVPAH